MTRVERLQAYFVDLAESLPDGLDPSGAQATKRRKIGTLLDAAGAERSSPKLRTELFEAARDAGLVTDIPLNDPGVDGDGWVHFSRTPFPEPEVRPPSESHLREWIIHNIGARGPLSGLYEPRKEFTIPGTTKRIDVLAKERSSTGGFKGWVVIECEKSSPTGAVKQLVGYVHAFAKTDLAEGRSVRGMVISSKADEAEVSLFAAHTDVDLCWFQFSADLGDCLHHTSG